MATVSHNQHAQQNFSQPRRSLRPHEALARIKHDPAGIERAFRLASDGQQWRHLCMIRLRVLEAIFDCDDLGEGSDIPSASVARIARATGLSPRTVNSRIADLTALGWHQALGPRWNGKAHARHRRVTFHRPINKDCTSKPEKIAHSSSNPLKSNSAGRTDTQKSRERASKPAPALTQAEIRAAWLNALNRITSKWQSAFGDMEYANPFPPSHFSALMGWIDHRMRRPRPIYNPEEYVFAAFENFQEENNEWQERAKVERFAGFAERAGFRYTAERGWHDSQAGV